MARKSEKMAARVALVIHIPKKTKILLGKKAKSVDQTVSRFVRETLDKRLARAS